MAMEKNVFTFIFLIYEVAQSFFHKTKISKGGSSPSPRRGHQSLGGRLPNILIIFAEKTMKLKKFWSIGGARAGPPKSATDQPLLSA